MPLLLKAGAQCAASRTPISSRLPQAVSHGTGTGRRIGFRWTDPDESCSFRQEAVQLRSRSRRTHTAPVPAPVPVSVRKLQKVSRPAARVPVHVKPAGIEPPASPPLQERCARDRGLVMRPNILATTRRRNINQNGAVGTHRQCSRYHPEVPAQSACQQHALNPNERFAVHARCIDTPVTSSTSSRRAATADSLPISLDVMDTPSNIIYMGPAATDAASLQEQFDMLHINLKRQLTVWADMKVDLARLHKLQRLDFACCRLVRQDEDCDFGISHVESSIGDLIAEVTFLKAKLTQDLQTNSVKPSTTSKRTTAASNAEI